MSFIIEKLYLYSPWGDIREICFWSHGLNVITGQSKTGKSAIIDIIDYCLGRRSFNVAEGTIRKKVAWFAVDLRKRGDRVFIARKNPGPSATRGSEVFFRRGEFPSVPPLEELGKNMSVESLKQFITRFVGIEENEYRPTTGRRQTLTANISHALFLCFQKQSEIASDTTLFHRQSEDFIPQAIKDTLPYFLGVFTEKHFLLRAELDESLEELRKLENEQKQKTSRLEMSQQYLRSLILEGQRLGLIDQGHEPADAEEGLQRLQALSDEDIYEPDYVLDAGETIERLKSDQRNLQEQIAQKQQDIRAAREFLYNQSEYSRESREQTTRLESIYLFSDTSEGNQACPLCESTLTSPPPAVEELKNALQELSREMELISFDSPHIQEHIANLEREVEQLTNDLKQVQHNLHQAIAEQEKAKSYQDQIIAKARFIGRVNSFIANLGHEERKDTEEWLKAAKERVNTLRERVNDEDISQRLDTFLGYINEKMSEYSKYLELEYSGSKLRLDPKKLTVVADTEDGPITLTRMGSGENWVGYHVLAHLALHWWLRRRNRPVPGFLVLDQVSQAHYPPDLDDEGRLEPLEDKDHQAVRALFLLIDQACKEIEPYFQVIVLDHAHIREEWFKNTIVEEWRGDNMLVPKDWPYM